MHPIAFEVWGRPIYWYGVLVAAGYASVVMWWAWLARREGRPEGFAGALAFWLMLSGILGARVAYVFANWRLEFALQPLAIFRIDQGGLVYYGGFLGGLAGFLLFARVKRTPVFDLGDYALSGLPLGHALGRIGCLLNGCCYGRITESGWGVMTHGVRRVPIQLYEALFNVALFAVLLILYRSKKRDGVVSVAYFLLYPAGRFLLEFWRGDERLRMVSLTLAQLTSVGFFAVGLLLMTMLPKAKKT